MKQYLIVGNGATGNAAAETIRRMDPEGRIVIFSKGKHDFYYVPALPDYLCGEKQLRDFTIHNQAWYKGIASSLSGTRKSPRSTRARRGWSRTEAGAFPLMNSSLPAGGIPSSRPSRELRHGRLRPADHRGCRPDRRRTGPQRGIEKGRGYRRRPFRAGSREWFAQNGFDRFRGRILPPPPAPPNGRPGGRASPKADGGDGIPFLSRRQDPENRSRRGGSGCFSRGRGKTPRGYRSPFGRRTPGNFPEEISELQIDKAVKVDDAMRTGQEGVYAAGDLIEHRGRYYGIWPAAMEQGRVARANMSGKRNRLSGDRALQHLEGGRNRLSCRR